MGEINDARLKSIVKALQDSCKFEFSLEDLDELLRNEVFQLAEITNKRDKIEREIEELHERQNSEIWQIQEKEKTYHDNLFGWILLVGMVGGVGGMILISTSIESLGGFFAIIFIIIFTVAVLLNETGWIGPYRNQMRASESNYKSKISGLESEKNSYDAHFSNLRLSIVKQLNERKTEIEVYKRKKLEAKLWEDVKAIESLHKNTVKRINEGMQFAEEKGSGKELFDDLGVKELDPQLERIKALLKQGKVEEAPSNIIKFRNKLESIESNVNDVIETIEKNGFWSKKIKAFLDAKGFVEPRNLSDVPEIGREWILQKFYEEHPELPIVFEGGRLVNIAFKAGPSEKKTGNIKLIKDETCNICLGAIKQGASIAVCEKCSRVYHQACADRVGVCPTCGGRF